MENTLGEILRKAFEELCPPELFNVNDMLDRKLYILQVVGLAIPRMHKPDFIRDLNGERNMLAHGHFEQSRFDDSYKIVKRDGRPVEKQAAGVDALGRSVEQVTNDLRVFVGLVLVWRGRILLAG